MFGEVLSVRLDFSLSGTHAKLTSYSVSPTQLVRERFGAKIGSKLPLFAFLYTEYNGHKSTGLST